MTPLRTWLLGLCVVLIGVGGVPTQIKAQTAIPFIVNYPPAEYGAYELNWAFAQDSLGRWYVGNNQGVLVFDGLRWELLPTPTPVRALSIAPTGQVLVGCKNDFGYLVAGPNGHAAFRSFRAEVPAGTLGTFERVLGIFPQTDASLVVTRNGMFRVGFDAEGTIRLKKLYQGAELLEAVQVGDEIWVASSEQTYWIVNGEQKRKGTPNGVPEGEIIFAAQPLGGGSYLLASGSNALYRYRNGQAERLAPAFADYINTYLLFSIAVSPNGKVIAIGTQTGGVVLTDENLNERARLAAGYLPSSDVYALKFDAQGGLWVAHGRGLSRLATGRMVTQVARADQLGGKVLTLAEQGGALWVGTTQGLFRVENGTVTAIESIRNQEVWSLAATDGGVLVGTSYGLYFASGTTSRSLEETRAVYALNPLGGGRVAFGGDRVVGELNCNADGCSLFWRDTTKQVEVTSLAADGANGLWIGTTLHGTVRRAQNGQWTMPSAQSDTTSIGFAQVLALVGTPWEATANGLRHLTHGNAGALPAYLPMPSGYSATGANVWATVLSRAAMRLQIAEEGQWSLAPINPLMLLGQAPTAITESNNVLWASVDAGVFRLPSDDAANSEVRTYVHRIRDLTTDSLIAQYPWPTELELPYGSRSVALEIAATDLANPRGIWAQYRNGADGQWSNLRPGGRLEIGQLNLGTNSIEVRILDTQGRWADAQPLVINVLAPWYLQWWVIAIAVVGLGVLIWLVVRLNVRRLEHQKQVLERTVADRTAEVNKQSAVIAEQNENLLESIRYAERIQKVMLPGTGFLAQHFAAHYLLFRPRNIVSGDFYWQFTHGDTLWLAAADCTGHGVPGALMSAIGINLLNVIVAQEPNLSTYEVLNRLDAGIRSALRQHEGGGAQMDGMDIALCKFNLNSREVEFSGANRPMYLQRGVDMIAYEADRSAIGGTDVSSFTSQRVELRSFDRVFLFSDGYPDQFGKVTNRKLGTKRMRTMLEETAHLPLVQQGQQLEAELDAWQQDAPQTDDILFISLEIR